MHLCWLTQNLGDVPEDDDWMSTKERSLMTGIRVSKKRNDWRLGRWTAKRAYCLFNKVQPAAMPAVSVLAAEDGGPDLYLGESPGPVSISISHSHGRGFCAVASGKRAVGCDLEWVEYASPDFFDDYFRAEEARFCREAPEEIKSISGYLVWSAKESCLKVIREGLRRDTRTIRIDADFSGHRESWNEWAGRCLVTARLFYGWWRFENGFVYTLASESPNSMPRELGE
jgi:4'-phosphopantetheinyl transferase